MRGMARLLSRDGGVSPVVTGRAAGNHRQRAASRSPAPRWMVRLLLLHAPQRCIVPLARKQKTSRGHRTATQDRRRDRRVHAREPGRARWHGRGLPCRRRPSGTSRRIEGARAGLVHDEASRERILRESQLAASIDHPNVIPVYEAGEADGHVYIAMRLVEGSDLRSVLRRDGRLEPARAIALVAQVAVCARRRARARPRAPRRQAEQRADRLPARAGALLPGRLRHHDHVVRPGACRRVAAPARHARVRRARAGARRSCRRARRRVLARMPPVRVPHG